MSVVWGIIGIFLSFFIVGIVYWFWGMIGSLFMAAAMGMGYGMGKFLGIAPRSQSQVGAWMTINSLLQIGIEWGLMIWVLSMAIGWFFQNSFISAINYYSSAIWFWCLVIDLFCLFVIGLMYGKVERMIRRGMSPSQE